ncbi:MAG: tyrosine-type recombinase/integrase [Stellaceae bacterium]
MPAAVRKIALTDKSMKAMKPEPTGKRRTVWDAMMPGLCVLVTGNGRRGFYVVHRLPGAYSPTWVKIGEYPVMSLAEAREKARQTLGAIAAGKRPKEEEAAQRRAEREEARQQQAKTFGAVAELFVSKHVPTLRTARTTEALIRRELIPVLDGKPIGEVRRRDVIELIEAIVARGDRQQGRLRPKSGGRYAARHAFAALSKLFNWAVSRDIEGLDANPVAGIKLADLLGSVESRDRVLNDREIRAIWRAAEGLNYPFGPLVQMLLLTGQRLSEIAEARWSEIDLDAATLTVPAERMKNKTAHVVPLTPAAVAILTSLPRFVAGDFVFTTTSGRRPVSGFSKMAERVRKAAGIGVHWQVHDLRRTVRTRLAEEGVSVFIAELVIAHVQSGVHAVYDLHKYDREKRAALAGWEAELRAIVDAPAPVPNILPMARAAARGND